MRKKFGSSRGMTLSELLIALLIFSLVAAAMATGVSAAVRVYHDSTRSSEAQTLCNTLAQTMMDILHNSHDAYSADGGLAAVDNDFYGEGVSFSTEDGEVLFGGKKILGSGAYTDLNAGLECVCTGDIFSVDISVFDSGGNELAKESFSVKVPRT